jgi:hypothetical protein
LNGNTDLDGEWRNATVRVLDKSPSLQVLGDFWVGAVCGLPVSIAVCSRIPSFAPSGEVALQRITDAAGVSLILMMSDIARNDRS